MTDTDRTCEVCSQPITGRADKRYCGGRCRLVMFHARRWANRDEEPRPPRMCEWCVNWLPEDAHPRRLYCNNACKQAYYRTCGGPPITAAELAGIGALVTGEMQRLAADRVVTGQTQRLAGDDQ